MNYRFIPKFILWYPMVTTTTSSGTCSQACLTSFPVLDGVEQSTATSSGDICDLPSENQPSSHLVVFREIPI